MCAPLDTEVIWELPWEESTYDGLLLENSGIAALEPGPVISLRVVVSVAHLSKMTQSSSVSCHLDLLPGISGARVVSESVDAGT